MAREQWVKIDVGMPTDEKLFRRSPLERHLWTCLLCLAKERAIETGSSVIYNEDGDSLSRRFNLGTAKEIERALAYFESSMPRPMLKRDEGGAITIINFDKRQGRSLPREEADAAWKDKRAHRERTNAVYFIRDEASGLVKIGTSKNPWARLNALVAGTGKKLTLLGTLKNCGYDVETELHARFKDARREGEWFAPVPDLIDVATGKVAVSVAGAANHSATDEGSRSLQQRDQDQDLDPDRSSEEISDPRGQEKSSTHPEGAWPPELLARLREATGKAFNDPGYLKFLETSLRHPRESRIAAGEEYLRRGYAKAGKGLNYLVGIIRDWPVGVTAENARKAENGHGDNGAARAKEDVAKTEAMLEEFRKKPRASPDAILQLGKRPGPKV